MAKLPGYRDAKGKNSSGSYARVFNHKAWGHGISRVQGTVIASGTYLETLIAQYCKTIGSEDVFRELLTRLRNGTQEAGLILLSKNTLTTYITPRLELARQNDEENDGSGKRKKKKKRIEPDFLIILIRPNERKIVVLEIKLGFDFDTKKNLGEKNHLAVYANGLGDLINDPVCPEHHFKVTWALCAFQEDDKDRMITGLKLRADEEETANMENELASLNLKGLAKTAKKKELRREFFIKKYGHIMLPGKEFCEITGIDRCEIFKELFASWEDNRAAFVEHYKAIPEFRNLFFGFPKDWVSPITYQVSVSLTPPSVLHTYQDLSHCGANSLTWDKTHSS